MSLLGDELRVEKIVLTQPLITVARERDGRFDFEPDTLVQFPIEEIFSTMSLKKLAGGSMDFSAALTFYGDDLDRAFERFESSQTFSLVDLEGRAEEGEDAVLGRRCEPFYSGAVASPG